MKKILLSLSAGVLVILIFGYVFRGPLLSFVIQWQIGPEQTFAEQVAPQKPNYEDDAFWAALPSRIDASDQLPLGTTREPSGVAVFFIHPTSYFKQTWNQPLDDEEANWAVDERILRHQASVFNGCCDVDAPRYRQATFFSFFDTSGDGEQALGLAYADVVDAFEQFIRRIGPGQPFILAGHSQGTRHATQLLREHIADTERLDDMVAAYLVGFSISHDQLGPVPACKDAQQTGCALGWNAMDGPGAGAFGDTANLLCTNPLSWRVDNTYVGHEKNLGGIGFPSQGKGKEGEDITQMQLEVGVADAQCIDGQLAVQELRSNAFPSRMLGNSMHIYDYSLYHMNIRKNAAQRIGRHKSN